MGAALEASCSLSATNDPRTTYDIIVTSRHYPLPPPSPPPALSLLSLLSLYSRSTLALKSLSPCTLPGNFVFAKMGEKEMDVLADAMERRVINKDDLLIKQGETGDFFYIVEVLARSDVHNNIFINNLVT